ncbi:MAG TPA: tetratricopeptide repeat protein [Candidatus Obscuribacterales bacterium]
MEKRRILRLKEIAANNQQSMMFIVVALAAILLAGQTAQAATKKPFEWPKAGDERVPPKKEDTAAPAKNARSLAKKEAAAESEEGRSAAKNEASAKEESATKDEVKSADRDPDRPYADEAIKHYNRGVELHKQGFLNQAVQEYKAAIEADDRVAEAYSNLGAIYLAQKGWAKAVEAFNKALTLKPDRPTTWNGLGNALYARGQIAEAKEKWRKALEVDPNFASAYYNMGNALESEKDSKAAIVEFMKAINANPKMADAYYRIGSILHKEKHPAQSAVFLAKAIEYAQPEADFLREAKKTLSALQAEFKRDSDTAHEVEMSVMPPQKEEELIERPNDSGSRAQAAKPEPSQKAESSGDSEKPAKKGLFRRKTKSDKSDKKVEMFVQPPDARDDLKPDPQSTGGQNDSAGNPWN